MYKLVSFELVPFRCGMMHSPSRSSFSYRNKISDIGQEIKCFHMKMFYISIKFRACRGINYNYSRWQGKYILLCLYLPMLMLVLSSLRKGKLYQYLVESPDGGRCRQWS